MKKTTLYFCLPILLLVFDSCGLKEKREEKIFELVGADSLEMEKKEVSFYFYEEEKEYPDAIIEMFAPLSNQKFSSGRIPFEFNIKNYPFGENLDGFKLNTILNSGDPVGHNSPIFQQELNEGTYRIVAYLVDSQGLALKEFGNYVDRDFMVGNTRPFPYSAEPYLALNLPANGQTYLEGEEVTIDFLVIGGDMLLDNLKVEIKVGDFHYEITEINPVRILNLPKGEHLVQLNLSYQDGKELDGPFSSVQKTIIVQ
ncbi:hypothetical protein MMU07_02605 [Aquiflexum sp. LQ15W]|uniref:hypothetical protein n=1 Tax=Cognataquiflexum nitidum TaxID=2922272 RepID=UPI001F131862|nr:hypothetical protein [Cognataquiflexum nitidum]MCH6198455.1 hypothetical protein [Cognataquiflexum nitidum]